MQSALTAKAVLLRILDGVPLGVIAAVMGKVDALRDDGATVPMDVVGRMLAAAAGAGLAAKPAAAAPSSSPSDDRRLERFGIVGPLPRGAAVLDGAAEAAPSESSCSKRVRELEAELGEWRARQRRERDAASTALVPRAASPAAGGGVAASSGEPDFAELRPLDAMGVTAADVIESLEVEMGGGAYFVDVVAARVGAPPPSKSGFSIRAGAVVRHAAKEWRNILRAQPNLVAAWRVTGPPESWEDATARAFLSQSRSCT